MENKGTYFIEILEIAHDVIDNLLESEPKNPGQIARELGLTRSRVFRVLKSLEERGYVLSLKNGYVLGYKFIQIFEKIKWVNDWFILSKSILFDLANSTGDVAHLFTRTGYHAVCTARYTGKNHLQVEKKVGEHIHLNVAGAPMAILANIPKREQEIIIKNLRMEKYTTYTIIDREQLQIQLKKIKSQGYSIDIEEYIIGGCAISAPLFDQANSVIGAVSVETPSVRFDDMRRTDNLSQVILAAKQMTENYANYMTQVMDSWKSISPH